MGWLSGSKPQRSAGRKISTSDRITVFGSSKGGFLGTAKGRQTWADTKPGKGTRKGRGK